MVMKKYALPAWLTIKSNDEYYIQANRLIKFLKYFKEKKLDPDSMSVKELVAFIIEYPSVLKRPIIINENELQVGYNNEDITIFLPKELRNRECFNSFDKDGDEN